MKKILLSVLVVCVSLLAAVAQSSLPAVDKSPMDISYYPANYPVLKVQDKTTEPLLARIVYSRPKKEGRTVFGGLVEYGQVWRLGANEATEIEFYKPVTIGGKKVAKGRYTLYAIVRENSWTFIINKETDTWGSFKYNAAKDVARAEAPVQKITDVVESLAMSFEKVNGKVNLTVAWENVKTSLPISL
ncbi:MAG: DUF2911 domain-containing protein [Chitinophagaceae bacterium]|nr:DUF2911 domain-containing protein [Chitinophagaceae bacterium]